MFSSKTADPINKPFLVCPCIILLFLALQTAMGQVRSGLMPSALPPGISLQISATPQSATVGDPIRLELKATMPAGYQAEHPALDKQAGDFSILEISAKPLPRKLGEPADALAPLHYQANIVAAAYRTGILQFPAVRLRLRAPDGKWFTAESSPVTIEIRSVLSEKDKELRDLKKQAEMPDSIRWGLWIGLLLALVLIAALGWMLWKRRRKKTPEIPALPPQDILDIAESELRQLLAGGFPQGAAVKPFYVRLSDIAKKMLEAGYGIRTAEQTSSEIMDSLRSGSGQAAEEMSQVESFLNQCDLAKFARYVPSGAEHDSAGREALRILDLCKNMVASRQPSVADPAGISAEGQ